jgi:hypothetical protein
VNIGYFARVDYADLDRFDEDTAFLAMNIIKDDSTYSGPSLLAEHISFTGCWRVESLITDLETVLRCIEV